MIENYRNIRFFTPNNFIITLRHSENTFKDTLQDFVNFICNELNINNYQIMFDRKMKSDVEGKFSIERQSILLNLNKFNLYKEYILNPNDEKFQDNPELLKVIEIYPFKILSTIIHELEHARQYEKYLNENIKEYENVETPLSDEPLYYLQKTEREAYMTELDEMNIFLNSLVQGNDKNLLTTLINETNNNFVNNYNTSLMNLDVRQLVSVTDEECGPENLENNLRLYTEIKELLHRETIFRRDYLDHEKYNDSYYSGTININSRDTHNNNLEYRIRNDNGKWNVRLRCSGNEIYFSLDEQQCRINQMVHYTSSGYSSKLGTNALNEKREKEIFKYVNAFIKMYHQEITSISFSNLIFQNKTLLNNFLSKHKSKLSKEDFFNFGINVFSRSEYNKAYDLVSQGIPLDILTDLNTIKNKKQTIDLQIER